MCFRFGDIACLLMVGFSASAADRPVLRVCADPNNLPFSNKKGEGFENRIAELIAKELGSRLEYTWFAQRRGFIRNTLRAGLCDAVMGVPANFDPVATTRPYYRSTYVFVSRKNRQLNVASLNDPRLKRLTIGVHIIGDDYSNPPPVHALGRRHIVKNVSGYTIYGDYSQPNPPARLIEAVSDGKVDIAIVWGPFAGYFGKKQLTDLRIVPVTPEADGPDLPFVFDIAMGVRKDDQSLRQELDRVLDTRRDEIRRILTDYGVPFKPIAHTGASVSAK
jgi:mxaJ protein